MNDDDQPGLPGDKQNELQNKLDETLDSNVSEVTPETEPSSVLPEDPANDSDTGKIVDDIVQHEGDELIEAHDERLTEAFQPQKSGWQQKLKDFFRAWWDNKIARWSTIAGLTVAFLAVLIIPVSRYFVLNTVGVRSRASVTVIDQSTLQPLKNMQVSLAGQKALTDKDGNASLLHIRLGSSHLLIEKRGFATIDKKITVGWGSNPLGSLSVTPQGSQYVLSFTDFLSKKPIAKAEATSGDASALSDDKGIIKITIDKPEDTVEVIITVDGYRDEKLSFSSGTKETQNVKAVPNRPHIFVSKRSGKYDVLKIDADGKNEQQLLAGTGFERDDITLVPHSSKNLAALVSTRDNAHNSDGFLLSTLTIINTTDGSISRIVQSERVQIIGWVGSRLVYVQVAAGSSAANPRRNRIMSYDIDTKSGKELASANYFNDMQIVGSKLFYAASSAYQSSGTVGLVKMDVDGNNKITVVSGEVWNIFRTSYGHLTLAQQQDWQDYQIADGKVTKLSGAPANPANRVYSDSPDGKHCVWVDNRDGKGVLLSYDPAQDKDTTLKTQNGLSNPISWLSNTTLVYRVNSGQETADYVLNIDGGDAQKLKDVTNTTGIDRWYYY